MRQVTLKTKDQHLIDAVHYEGGSRKAVILAHGFYNAKDAHIFREITKALAVHYDVVAFDFRGHGKSSGLFTWTSKECADLQAVIDHVKTFKYDSIGLMGFSLGAAISLIEAAQNTEIKTVIAVSAPSDLWKIDFHFWEAGMLDDLKLNFGFKSKGKGIRPSHPWEMKIAPIDIIDRISPRPVLFIHGKEDWLIKPSHSEELYNRAKEPKKIIILEKLGHAETMFDQQPDSFMKPCLDWFREHL
jgi:pimeloyl-ACP methyl ester carboxylesterase